MVDVPIFKDFSELETAYRGYQYPLPPSWKYAVRLQDQINWLLQACIALNAQGISVDYLTEQLTDLDEQLTKYIDDGDAYTRELLTRAVDELTQQILDIEGGLFYSRNPVRGFRDEIYVSLKMMYDALRTQALTWSEFDALDMTWDELKASGHSWLEVDLFSNIYWGDSQPRAKWTDPDTIDTMSPGFHAPGVAELGRTWAEINTFGFLTRKDG